jgi:FkbM family methyltransferase
MKNPPALLAVDKWIIATTRFGFRIFVYLNELAISRPILMDQYEPDAVALFQSLIKPGDRVIDVGANIGFHSLILAQLVGTTGQVLSFEPVKYLYDPLVASIAENNFQDRCQAFNCAVSDRAGRTLIRYLPGAKNFGGSHLSETRSDDGHAYDEVETKTLSDFMSDRRFSFIKVDAEGAEPKVLGGATDLLKRDRPLVFAELHNIQLQLVSGSTATELIQWMAKLGYRCFKTNEGRQGEEIWAYEASEIINVLFVPNS